MTTVSNEWYDAVSNSFQFSEKDVISSVESLMLNILKGKNIILDVVDLSPFLFSLESNFIRYKAYKVYVYSPPHALIQHMTQRLQKSLLTLDKEEMRLFFPYEQYLNLYKISRFNTELCLTKGEMLSNFTGMLLIIIENSGLPNLEKNYLIEFLKKREDEEKLWREKVNSEWFSGNGNAVYLKPKCQNVDLLLDTSVLSTNEAVSFVLPILNSVINRDN